MQSPLLRSFIDAPEWDDAPEDTLPIRNFFDDHFHPHILHDSDELVVRHFLQYDVCSTVDANLLK